MTSPATLHFHPYDLLRAINRDTGGADYELLKGALARLQATIIRTNIRAKGKKKFRQFSWLESWEDLVDERTGQSKGMSLTLSEWLYEGHSHERGSARHLAGILHDHRRPRTLALPVLPASTPAATPGRGSRYRCRPSTQNPAWKEPTAREIRNKKTGDQEHPKPHHHTDSKLPRS